MLHRLLLVAVLLASCDVPDVGDAGLEDAGVQHDAGSTFDAGTPDSGTPFDAGLPDGTPTRMTCTSRFGTALTGTFGRLDGRLISLVPASTSSCNNDPTHLHLQILVMNAVYDVAVNLDALEFDKPGPLLGGPWAEGWHTGIAIDYWDSFQTSSAQFVMRTQAATRQALEGLLATTNHISVFGTRYPDGTGTHLIHRNGFQNDGAIVLEPRSGLPRVVMFRFASQAF